ncbi:hypothetical protein BD414DRAFT_501573 [Trametes punicea]|nr:hypothetical protein BD414DRAFT_501573 [Trametes punicea]
MVGAAERIYSSHQCNQRNYGFVREAFATFCGRTDATQRAASDVADWTRQRCLLHHNEAQLQRPPKSAYHKPMLRWLILGPVTRRSAG